MFNNIFKTEYKDLLRATCAQDILFAQQLVGSEAVGNIPIIGRDKLFKSSLDHHLRLSKLIGNFEAAIATSDNAEDIVLHKACFLGEARLAQRLIQNGLDVNSTTAHGATPLHYAVSKNNFHSVALLLTSGVDIHAKMEDGTTALHIAVAADYVNLATLLVARGARIDCIDSYRRTPLHVAISGEGSVEIIRFLLMHDAPIHACTHDGETPLHYAVRVDKLDIIRLLLNQSASPNTVNANGDSPLHLAVIWKAEIMELLLRYGGNPNIQNQAQCTPLHYAACWSIDMDILEHLITFGARIDARDAQGNTPLHGAIRNANLATAICLCMHPPNDDDHAHDSSDIINAQNDHLETPLHTFLLNPFFCNASETAKFIELLLAAGADVDAKGEHGNAPLHYATMLNNGNALRCLIETGAAQLDVRNVDQRTPLHYAAWMSNVQVVRLLLDAGACVSNIHDIHGFTPLHLAIAAPVPTMTTTTTVFSRVGGKGKGRRGVGGAEEGKGGNSDGQQMWLTVQLLLERGANASAMDAYHGSPLQIALVHGYENVVRLLHEYGTKEGHSLREYDDYNVTASIPTHHAVPVGPKPPSSAAAAAAAAASGAATVLVTPPEVTNDRTHPGSRYPHRLIFPPGSTSTVSAITPPIAATAERPSTQTTAASETTSTSMSTATGITTNSTSATSTVNDSTARPVIGVRAHTTTTSIGSSSSSSTTPTPINISFNTGFRTNSTSTSNTISTKSHSTSEATEMPMVTPQAPVVTTTPSSPGYNHSFPTQTAAINHFSHAPTTSAINFSHHHVVQRLQFFNTDLTQPLVREGGCGESRDRDRDREGDNAMEELLVSSQCLQCRQRRRCVVMLPCRHLSLCETCTNAHFSATTSAASNTAGTCTTVRANAQADGVSDTGNKGSMHTRSWASGGATVTGRGQDRHQGDEGEPSLRQSSEIGDLVCQICDQPVIDVLVVTTR